MKAPNVDPDGIDIVSWCWCSAKAGIDSHQGGAATNMPVVLIQMATDVGVVDIPPACALIWIGETMNESSADIPVYLMRRDGWDLCCHFWWPKV